MDIRGMIEELQSTEVGRTRKVIMWLGVLLICLSLMAVLTVAIVVVIHTKAELGANEALYGQLRSWSNSVTLPVKAPALFGGGELKGDNLQFQTLVYLAFGTMFAFLLLNIKHLGPLPLVAFSLLTFCTDANVGPSAATLALFFGSFALIVFHQKGGVNWSEQIALSVGFLAGYLIIAFVLVEPLGSVFYDLWPMNGLLRILGYTCFVGMQLFVGANKKLSAVAAIGAGSYIQFIWLGQGVNQWLGTVVKFPPYNSWAQVVTAIPTPAFRNNMIGLLPWLLGSLIVIYLVISEMKETSFASDIWNFLEYFVIVPFSALTFSEWFAIHNGLPFGPLPYMILLNVIATGAIVEFGLKGEGGEIKKEFTEVQMTFVSGLQRVAAGLVRFWVAPMTTLTFVIVVLFLSPFNPQLLDLVKLLR